MSASASLVEQVLAGGSRDLQMMAAGGVLPVPPSELIPLQIALARGPDREVAERALGALRNLTPKLVASFLAEEASSKVLNFFALEVDSPEILEAILQRRDVPRSLLRAVAASLSPDLQEILLLRQDAIVEEPRILEALELNPHLSLYTKRRIAEYREHLLPRERKEEEPAPVKEASPEEVKAAIEMVKATVPPEGEQDDLTGLTEQQIRMLSVPVRMTLTRGASRVLRTILIRDTNSTVALACLTNNQFSDQEIENICLNRNSHDEILGAICRNRQWMSRYLIIGALVRNPRTPVGVAVRLVPRLSVRDLKDVGRDRNVPDPVRKTADRLYRIKVR